MSAVETPVVRRDRGVVATLTLNRPAQFNALSSDLLHAAVERVAEIAHDRRVRVVVIAGAGKAFCAGHDLRELRDHPDEAFTRRVFQRCTDLMLALRALPQPVIARVHGVAAAAGCQLVAQCDLAIAAEEARFATSGINVGLFCATPAVPLARAVPAKAALELLLTGAFVDAHRAAALGLVNRVVPGAALDAAIDELADAIAARPPVAIREGKRFFHEQLALPLHEAYARATSAMVAQRFGAEGMEGIAAFVDKRPPRWPAE